MPDSSKHCVICGMDCAGQPRLKDARGRYYHKECVVRDLEKKAQKSQQAAVTPESLQETGIELDAIDIMDEIASEALQASGSQHTCASCGLPMSAHNVICMNCGFDSQSGFALEENVDIEMPQRVRSTFVEKASVILCTNFVVGMAVFVCIVAILLIILTISK